MAYALVVNAAIVRTGDIPQVFTRSDGSVVAGYHLRPDLWPADGWLPVEDEGPTPGPLQAGTVVLTVEAARVVRTWTAIADVPEAVNGDTLRTNAVAALAANRTFLAITTPTNAQTLAQVRALTRQVNALARLQLGRLDGTD
jgi:hypothetical protein